MQKKGWETTQYNLFTMKGFVSKSPEKIVIDAFQEDRMYLRIKMNAKGISKIV